MEHAASYATADPYEAVYQHYAWEADRDYAARLDANRTRTDEKVASLRSVGDLVTGRDLPMPALSQAWDDGVDYEALWWVDDVDALRILRRAIGSPGGGRWDKQTENGSLRVDLPYGRLRLSIRVHGSVCEKVETGETREVERYVDVCPFCDAVLAQVGDDWHCSDDGCEFYRPAAKRAKRTVTEPVVEWRCPDVNGEVEA